MARWHEMLKQTKHSTILASVVLAVAACGNGGGGGGGGGGGSSPTLPTVTVTMPTTLVGTVNLQVTLQSDLESTADVVVEVSRDGGATFHPASTFGAEGLSASAAGTQHVIRWDTLADLGFRPLADAQLRVSTRVNGATGTPVVNSIPAADNLGLAVSMVERPMLHYGPVDDAVEDIAKKHDLVVIHPSVGAVTVAAVRRIQQGTDPDDPSDDVIVLGYLSIGEDQRTTSLTDAQMLLDPRFVGDGSGPRVDPRGPDADGQSLVGIDPLGIPSPGGTGYASWYLDDNSVDQDPTNIGDGLPDRNAHFGGAFVNAGDPAWFEVLDAMTIDGVDGIPGMQELLTDDVGRGYALDGLFFDTVDTCAPNSFTDPSSGNQSEFEWTAPGFTAFMTLFKQRYPSSVALQNRGLFFYDPRHPHYATNPRSVVDFVLFESYRLNSNNFETFNTYFFADNRHNIAPKLMAEANRADGFRVLSLGYAEGPGIDLGTLTGTASAGATELDEDIRQSEELVGFRHYLSDAGVALANTYVLDLPLAPDATPPSWSSTFNDNAQPWPTPAAAPTPRIGIQQVVPGSGSLTVRWDVALDRSRVGYALYSTTGTFDFANDPTLAQATRTELFPAVGEQYLGLNGFPNQAVVNGLQPFTPYSLCVRTFDAFGNEDDNQVVLQSAPLGQATIQIDGSFTDWDTIPLQHSDPDDVPDSAGPDWLDVRIVNDGNFVYVRFSSANPFNLDGSPTYGFSRTLIFVDVDANASTGYQVTADCGSELLVAGSNLFAQAAGVFNNGQLTALAIEPRTAVTDCELAIPLAQIRAAFATASTLRFVFVNDDVSDYAPDTGVVEFTIVD